MQSGQQPRDPESLVVEKEVINVFDHWMAVPWSDLRKSRSFLGIWGWGNPGSGAKRRRTGRGQESPATKASENKGREHME
jgi:hypothetical protein